LNKQKTAWLFLEDGTHYKGKSFGSTEQVEGEVVFNTGMTGYQEVLTDPSYAGQIVTMTYPQIGNYGLINDDSESDKIQVRGFIVREHCDHPSNWRCESTIGSYLSKNKIGGIEGIDTRALTKKLRNSGTMRGFITTEEPGSDTIESFISNMSKRALEVEDIGKVDLVMGVTTKKEIIMPGDNLHVGVVDFGMKLNIARSFNNMGHKVTVFPAFRSPEEIKSHKLDFLLLSNGPGDPVMVTYGIRMAQELFGKIPMGGICLGHQIISLALGCKTYKLKFGHRGANHPVRDLMTNKVWITTQNHGYAVDIDSVPKGVELTHLNLNDNTNEGIMHKEKNIFFCSVPPGSSARSA
jgi:carbamoyl-phosphate synthase small subunit